MSPILEWYLNDPGAFMVGLTVGQANLSPIGLGRRRVADADRRRRTLAPRDQQRSGDRGLVRGPVERAAELRIVRSLLDDVTNGGSAPVLSGEQGTGKTTLLDANERPDAELRDATAKSATLLNSDGEVDAAHRVLVAAIDNAWSRPDHDVTGVLEALHTLGMVCYFGDRAELWAPFQRALDLLGDEAPPVLRLLAATCQDPVAASVSVLLEVEDHIGRLRAGDPDPAKTVRVGMAAHVVGRLPDCRSALRRVFLGTSDKNVSDWAVRAGVLLAIDAVDAGQWAEAATLAEKCIGLCAASGQRLWAWSGRYVLALVAAGRASGTIAGRRQMTWSSGPLRAASTD